MVVSHGTLIRLVLSALHGIDHPRVENGEVIELGSHLTEGFDGRSMQLGLIVLGALCQSPYDHAPLVDL